MAKGSVKVRDARMQGNVLTAELDRCPFREGEEIDLDTEKMRVTGVITWKLGHIIKMRVSSFIDKRQIN
ncbi:MAG: hypothetical protein GY804_09870 [Alphaproteobacteria bacterium]|nr:hypothetical protein [Alphaproteobacteria bacterium]